MSVTTVPDGDRARADDDTVETASLLRRGFRVLARFVRLNPLPFSIAIVGAVIYAGASVLGTLVLGRVTDKVLTPSFNGTGVSDSTTWSWVALIVGVSVLRAIGTVTRRYFAGKTTWLGQAWLRNSIADHFLAVPLDFHRGSSTGELLAHADSDVLAATEVVNPLPFSTGLVVLIIFSVIALFVVDPILALVGLVLFPLMALLNRYYTRRVERPAAAVQAHVGEVSGIAHESFDGALMVKSLGLEDHEVARLSVAADELRQERIQVGRLRAFFEPALDALPNLGIIAILAVGSWRISEGVISPGDVVQAMALFTLLAFPMRVVGFLLEEMPRAVVATERLDRILAADVAPEPHDHETPPASPAEVEVRGVSYSYPTGEAVLTDVNLTLAAGEVVALVGPTGCGKSTLCELLVGLVSPDSGTIRVHGLPPDRLRREARRDLLALVFQESFVFADTVQENVLVGTDHGVDRLTHTLGVAQATRFVAAMPAGTQTVLGERGVSVSGGQRQRLALARALARRPQLLVLDDATSAIDPRVEAQILKALREELRMTTLVVAQRRSTVELADRIIRMQAGRVVASGTHAELLATDPDYAAMLSAYDTAVPGDYDDDCANTDEHDAALDALAEVAHDSALDEFVDRSHAHRDGGRDDPDLDEDTDEVRQPSGGLAVLRKGVRVMPEIREGIVVSLLFAVAVAAGKLLIPVAIQQVLDKGVLSSDGFDAAFVAWACAGAAVGVIVLMFLSRLTYLRLVKAAEGALYSLRVRVFEHIHRLSVAEQNETKRGVLVARVTSDIETLARFVNWGAISWVVNSALVVGTLIVMSIYSWQLTLITIVTFLPVIPILRFLQRRQLVAYDKVRTQTGDMLAEFSETITGAAAVRAYGLEDRSRDRIHDRVQKLYYAHREAGRYFALMFPVGDLFGSIALAAVVAIAAFSGVELGLDLGTVVAFAFLMNLLLFPIAEISEIIDQTQTAVAGWRKVLDVLDIPIDVSDDPAGTTLPSGALPVVAEHVDFSYRTGPPVLIDVSVSIPAGTNVAIVGETGSGKTTFASILCRLADPTGGRMLIGGQDLKGVTGESRRQAVRLVPQDGFLFDTSIRENVRVGRLGATDREIEHAFAQLGLDDWVERLPAGLDTVVGERGDGLSVGERQLVALVRAHLAAPGLLVLDEATSAVDPETERALTTALLRVAQGATTVSIAHRLSTAEAADLVLVFDAGRIVEQGPHETLVAAGGVYASLFDSWVGATRGSA